jgi:hypothetical protein
MQQVFRFVRFASFSALALVATTSGCDCSHDTVGPAAAWRCEATGRRPGPEDSPCGTSQRYVKGLCQVQRCDAGEQPAGCCPGMLCTQGGECLVPPSRLTLCETDGNCDPGQRCLSRPLIHPDAKTCGFPPVDENGNCPDGSQAFDHRCFAGDLPPCGGDCPPGAVCNIDTNRCEEPPTLTNAGHGCDQECGEAQILVYSDPDSMLWDQCCAVTCECLTLPPLLPGLWGRYSAIAIGGDRAFVSAYDSTYGDLVVADFDAASTNLVSLEYVDGVPSGGTVVADPNGPRGGRNGPGPNVGEHTSIALQDGEPRVAYYDLEAGSLKYAAWDAQTRAWAISLIDDGRYAGGTSSGDVGRYTSLFIDNRGIAHVSYYAHRAVIDGQLVTGPIYARARTTAPAGWTDWERVPIESFTSCSGQCLSTQACALDSGTPTCLTARTDCASGCACDETCVEVATFPVCRPSLPGSLTEPCDGSCPADFVCVADGTSGTICLRERASDCGSSCTADDKCVDDGAANAVCRRSTPYSTLAGLPEGVGLFTSLAIYDDAPLVAYYDRFLGQLRGAIANFSYSQTATSFTAMPIACEAGVDIGQFSTVAIAADGLSFAIAFQAAGGILRYYTGQDFLTGNFETIDDGRRDSRLNIVGGSASLVFDPGSGVPYVAYHDQTENDLLIGYRRSGVWAHATLLADGAYGSFARLAIAGSKAYTINYLRARDELDRDTSHLVLTVTLLSTLP